MRGYGGFYSITPMASQLPRKYAAIAVRELVQRSGYLLGTTIARFGAATRMVMLHGQVQEESRKYTSSARRKRCQCDVASCIYTDVIVALFVREQRLRFIWRLHISSAVGIAAAIRLWALKVRT